MDTTVERVPASVVGHLDTGPATLFESARERLAAAGITIYSFSCGSGNAMRLTLCAGPAGLYKVDHTP